MKKPKRFKPPGARSREERAQEYDDRRGSASERGYTWEWAKARADFLVANPLCVRCLARGLTVRATVVDHIKPHKGDPVLFWDRSNWQSLCGPDHSAWKQRVERGTLPPWEG